MNPVSLPIANSGRFTKAVAEAADAPLHASSLETVQVNIGLRCNLACRHCHVESSPTRREEMTWTTMAQVLAVARATGVETIDITGGAPEMHPQFRSFVKSARRQGHTVIVRTNLSILLEPGYGDLPTFLRDQRVRLVASLPCYLETNVDRQRGRGVYHGSIEAIRRLNAVGYGREPHLPLDLVYNPAGPTLPPAQADLEQAYRTELLERWDIAFTRLLCITNVPIGRFLHDLERDGDAEQYHRKLQEAFNPATLDGLMCRHQIHVSSDGTLHDCDFNYALGLPIAGPGRPNISQVDPEALKQRVIRTDDHCFACTAGSGSSCGGALTS